MMVITNSSLLIWLANFVYAGSTITSICKVCIGPERKIQKICAEIKSVCKIQTQKGSGNSTKVVDKCPNPISQNTCSALLFCCLRAAFRKY
jgi:hypothetical protein